MLVEVIGAEIEPLEFRRKVRKQKTFDLLTHDPDETFSNFFTKQRDRPVIESNGATRRQTAKRCDLGSVAAAGTKPQRSASDGHGSRESAKAAGVIAERNRRCDNIESFVLGKQHHEQWHCPNG